MHFPFERKIFVLQAFKVNIRIWDFCVQFYSINRFFVFWKSHSFKTISGQLPLKAKQGMWLRFPMNMGISFCEWHVFICISSPFLSLSLFLLFCCLTSLKLSGFLENLRQSPYYAQALYFNHLLMISACNLRCYKIIFIAFWETLFLLYINQ